MKIDLTHIVVVVWDGELIRESVCDYDGEVGSENVYNRRAEPVLVSLSDLYSEDSRISQ